MRTVLAILTSPWSLLVWILMGLVLYVFVTLASPPSFPATSDFRAVMDMLTGGDPKSLDEVIRDDRRVWVCAWVVHLIAWLYIPAVVGIFVGRAVSRAERHLSRFAVRDAIAEFAEQRGWDKELKEEFVQRAMEHLDEYRRSVGEPGSRG